MFANGQVTSVTGLPSPTGEEQLYVAPGRLAAGSSVVVFQTNSPIPGFNNGGEYGQVYRYDLTTNGLACVSCPRAGETPTGTANLSNDSVAHTTHLILDSRGVSEDGSEIFFDSPDRLVTQDENEARDVYEWHEGRLSLISSGKGTADSLFLDNSASGDDVFFATKDNLSGTDTDGSYDVYDARVDGGFPPPSPPSPPSCVASCQTPPTTAPPSFSLPSANLVSAELSPPPPPPGVHPVALSRAQKLLRSLRECRKKHGKSRHVCEVLARRRYGKRPQRGHT